MGTDYSDAAKSIVKVRFPPTQQLASGAWGQRWRVETDIDIPTERAILDSAERVMGQDAFEVRIGLTGRRSADLLVTLRDDPAQGRFLYAIYNAFKVFDHVVARIGSVEGQPREHWIPLREPMQPEDWIAGLISEYIQTASALSQRLGGAFAQSNLLQGRRDKVIPRAGQTADGLEFNFHGVGCRISDGHRSVDFDFLPDGQVDGFDAWRLHVFTEENPSVVGVRSHQEVQLALELLARRGLVQPVEGSRLYRRRTMRVEQ